MPKSYENPVALTKAQKRLKRLQRKQARREEARERILALPKDYPARLVCRSSNLQDARERLAKLGEHIGSSG